MIGKKRKTKETPAGEPRVALLIRGVPEAVRAEARAQAARDRRTLRDVVIEALRQYGRGKWTPWGETRRPGVWPVNPNFERSGR